MDDWTLVNIDPEVASEGIVIAHRPCLDYVGTGSDGITGCCSCGENPPESLLFGLSLVGGAIYDFSTQFSQIAKISNYPDIQNTIANAFGQKFPKTQ